MSADAWLAERYAGDVGPTTDLVLGVSGSHQLSPNLDPATRPCAAPLEFGAQMTVAAVVLVIRKLSDLFAAALISYMFVPCNCLGIVNLSL